MLAVPVAVAAMIGFGTSLSGVTEGLGALASGPPATQATSADDPGRARIDRAISRVTTSTGDPDGAAPGPAARAPGGDDGGTGTGGQPEPPAATPTVPDTGTDIGGGDGAQPPVDQPVPQIDVPTGDNPGGGGLQGLLNDVGDAVNQLLGGG